MTFQEFLGKKKIDSTAFQKHEPVRFAEWQNEFEQMHPNSFTMQKFYLLNPTRRKYPLKEIVEDVAKATATTPKPKPVFKPKPKI